MCGDKVKTRFGVLHTNTNLVCLLGEWLTGWLVGLIENITNMISPQLQLQLHRLIDRDQLMFQRES